MDEQRMSRRRLMTPPSGDNRQNKENSVNGNVEGGCFRYFKGLYRKSRSGRGNSRGFATPGEDYLVVADTVHLHQPPSQPAVHKSPAYPNTPATPDTNQNTTAANGAAHNNVSQGQSNPTSPKRGQQDEGAQVEKSSGGEVLKGEDHYNEGGERGGGLPEEAEATRSESAATVTSASSAGNDQLKPALKLPATQQPAQHTTHGSGNGSLSTPTTTNATTTATTIEHSSKPADVATSITRTRIVFPSSTPNETIMAHRSLFRMDDAQRPLSGSAHSSPSDRGVVTVARGVSVEPLQSVLRNGSAPIWQPYSLYPVNRYGFSSDPLAIGGSIKACKGMRVVLTPEGAMAFDELYHNLSGGGPGTITRVLSNGQVCRVQWDKDSCIDHCYRTGRFGRFELALAEVHPSIQEDEHRAVLFPSSPPAALPAPPPQQETSTMEGVQKDEDEDEDEDPITRELRRNGIMPPPKRPVEEEKKTMLDDDAFLSIVEKAMHTQQQLQQTNSFIGNGRVTDPLSPAEPEQAGTTSRLKRLFDRDHEGRFNALMVSRPSDAVVAAGMPDSPSGSTNVQYSAQASPAGERHVRFQPLRAREQSASELDDQPVASSSWRPGEVWPARDSLRSDGDPNNVSLEGWA